MISTVDNYLSGLTDTEKCVFNCSSTAKKYISNHLEISIGDYLKHKNNKIFHFPGYGGDESNVNASDIIISVLKRPDALTYQIQTGNYVGKFFWGEVEVEIGSRFSESFLKRMLNFANDIFLDDIDSNAKSTDQRKLDITQFILYYLFTQSLEKAYLLGLPKSYQTLKTHDMTLKGRIDIAAFLNKDIPFKGQISSIVREQKETQEIVDVINKAVEIVSLSGFSTRSISNIKTHLKEVRSKTLISNAVIHKALESKSLRNPIYAPYKKVLEYAKTIINTQDIQNNREANERFHGFIINVAELFEVYITKLLRKEFKNWSVASPKIQLYENSFYKRKIIPDIVMMKEKKVIVFDTKYKRMQMRGNNLYGMGDLDREDFFQINTYMSYFNNQNYDVIAGGLIYPMDKFDKSECYTDDWLGKSNSKFIVDGIDFSKLEANNFVDIEKSFISRVNHLIYPT